AFDGDERLDYLSLARCVWQRIRRPFINGGNGEHARSCQRMSPFINGGNGPSATLCQRMSPFINGDNEGHARSCQWMSPFINGGNGESARRCQVVTRVGARQPVSIRSSKWTT